MKSRRKPNGRGPPPNPLYQVRWTPPDNPPSIDWVDSPGGQVLLLSLRGRHVMNPVKEGTLEETITLRQARKLIQCMAHEQSFLLLSPPGVGKSDMVYQAAAAAGLPCRSLLGTQIAPEDV